MIDLPERDHDGRARHRDGPARDMFERHVDLPRGPEREVVYDGRRSYTLRGSETRTPATVGAFRVVSSRDPLDAHGRRANPRAGDLRHLREQGLIETRRVPGTRDHAVGLTAAGCRLLEAHRAPGHGAPASPPRWHQEYLASGMSIDDIVSGFPDLTSDDIRACLAFAADREKRLVKVPA